VNVTVLLLAAFGCSPEHRAALPTSLRIDALAVPGAQVHWYEVSGRTRPEILESLLRHSPEAGIGAHVAASTSWQVSWSLTQDDAGNCRTDQPATVQKDVRVELPAWSVPPTASQAEEQEWMAYIRALAAHESGHVVRINAAADALGSEVTGATCDDANAAGYQALDALQAANIDYDHATQYGATQGVDFWSGAALDIDSALLRHVATTVE
jgi:predicted secreted Zn-dependent protease